MAIWFEPFTIEQIQARGKGTMIEHIGIQLTEIGSDFLMGTMPVDHRTIQPMKILHGGASVVLAETLGSLAANLVVNPATTYCVGMEINANHIRAAGSGLITGTAKPFHLGSSTQVWNIEMMNEERKLICISRLTMAVLKKPTANR